ncbi:MAG: DUF3524 domain-containing protein [Planctomycetes bacterium]|nr:DUF3524 domain-containing protein [Planctomycetota bacterium]
MRALRVLAFEPYYGGSHRAFLDTWIEGSRHDWTVFTLPARHWKWRMRGSAIWFADQIADTPAGRFDVLFTCDMTSVADLRALLPQSLSRIPIVCYFHENQLTYPISPHDRLDYQFGLTNITSALASDQVWFNSRSHRDAFLKAVRELLRIMPENLSPIVAPRIEAKSSIQYPAVKSEARITNEPRPRNSRTRFLWSHRWEYDKNPADFFDAMVTLHERKVEFELAVVGETFRKAPPEFHRALETLEPHIVHAGFLPSRQSYWSLLESCDWVVSTAIQENFGLAVVEAILAGCQPLLPNRLSYPELIRATSPENYLYDTDEELLERLASACSNRPIPIDTPINPSPTADLIQSILNRFGSTQQIPRLDEALENVTEEPSPSASLT